MGKTKRRKPPTMPRWFCLDIDGCWFCNDRNNCSNCSFVKKYRKEYFVPKQKGRHAATSKRRASRVDADEFW